MTFEQRFQTAALRALYRYWQELRREGTLPSRADIDPARIPGVLDNIGLFDVEAAPRRYRIRLMGMQIVRWYGCDLTGRYLDEIDFGDRPVFTFALLDQVVEQRVAGHMTGEYTKQDGRTIRYERLFVPLSNTGSGADMVIGAAFELPPGASILGDSLDLPDEPLTALGE